GAPQLFIINAPRRQLIRRVFVLVLLMFVYILFDQIRSQSIVQLFCSFLDFFGRIQNYLLVFEIGVDEVQVFNQAEVSICEASGIACQEIVQYTVIILFYYVQKSDSIGEVLVRKQDLIFNGQFSLLLLQLSILLTDFSMLNIPLVAVEEGKVHG